MLKITAGLGKTAQDRVVGSGFRVPDELGMTFAQTVKPGRIRFCRGIVSKSLLKHTTKANYLKLTGLPIIQSSAGRSPAGNSSILISFQASVILHVHKRYLKFGV